MNRDKYNSKTTREKAAIIKEYDKQKGDMKTLARRHKIGLSTLSGYLKNRDTILNSALSKGSSKSFRHRRPQHDALEQQLYNDFCKMKRHSLPAIGKFLNSSLFHSNQAYFRILAAVSGD